MHRRFASADRLQSAHSTRSELARSPYAKNYRTNLTHDQRELLSHRQNVSKLQRRDLEDRYIALMDDHFELKKDNASNHEKIKKLATKLLRISADGKHRGAPFPMQLAPNENLEIQIVKLESYNALLKDRLSALIRRFGGGIRSASVTGMRPASCSNLSLKRKITISQDDLHLLEVPEFPDESIKNKFTDDRKPPPVKCICKSSPRQQPTNTQSPRSQQSLQREPSIAEEKPNASSVSEVAVIPASPNDKINYNDMKNTIEKLKNELSETESDMKKLAKVNAALEERLTNEILSKRITENVELIELRQTVVECGTEFAELRREYLMLKSKTEAELDEEQRKISELKVLVETEVTKNKTLREELAALQNAANIIETMRGGITSSEDDKQLCTPEDNQRSPNRPADPHSGLSKLSNRNAELTSLLKESMQTIKDLRDELASAKRPNDDRRCFGDGDAGDVKKHREVLPSEHEHTDADIPLEPYVKVKKDIGASSKEEKRADPKSSDSSDGGTYNINEPDRKLTNDVVKKRPEIKTLKSSEQREKRRSRHQETASEVSSIDSDDNFKSFKKKSRNLQNSLLLVSPNGVPLNLTARLNLLERAAYHQPLSANGAGGDISSGLTCNCGQGGCRRANQSIYEDIHIAVENAKALLLKEFKTISITEPNDSNTTKSVSVNGMDETSDCREFLRVQYNLNNLYKQELEMMYKSCNDQTDALMTEVDNLREKLQKYEEKINTLELTSSEMVYKDATTSHERAATVSRVLDIGRDQGAFEMHIESFKLTKEGNSLLSCRHGALGSLYFTWNFYNFSMESRTSLRKGPAYVFQDACIYLVDMRRSFLQYIKQKPLELRLLAEVGTSPIAVGKTQLNLSEVLIFPQNKIQLDTKVMSVDGECCSHMNAIQCSCLGSATRRRHLGNLSVWFRLTCEMEALKMHTEQFWTASDQSQAPKKRTKARRAADGGQLSEKDTYASSTGLSLSDADETFVDREHSGRGKQVDFKVASLQPNEISITIGNLSLNGNSDIFTDPSVKRIFIEYNFLGSNETPSIAIRKLRPKSPEETNTTITIPIDSRKIFRIDTAQTGHDRKAAFSRLMKLLKQHEKNIKFLIVSEQSRKDKEKLGEGNDCLEIALGLLHLGRVVAEAPANCLSQVVHVPIMSKNHPYNSVGHLEVVVGGVDFMQQLADGY